MKKWNKAVWMCVAFTLLSNPNLRAQEDAKGCKDHPMFTRMQDFYLKECEQKDFGPADFVNEKGAELIVEGKLHWAEYGIKRGAKALTDLQIIRNFQNAIKKIQGTLVYEKIGSNYGYSYMKLSKAGQTFWVILNTSAGEKYQLTIVEKSEMAQEVIADAKSLMNDIREKGHASVYGIYFDHDKANIKPESEPAIKEIARLFQENKGLTIYIVGHTDNVGTLEYNLTLSKARADAVMKELTAKYNIAAGRLKSYGVACLAPAASNATEEGRAKNRRVELVEQ